MIFFFLVYYFSHALWDRYGFAFKTSKQNGSGILIRKILWSRFHIYFIINFFGLAAYHEEENKCTVFSQVRHFLDGLVCLLLLVPAGKAQQLMDGLPVNL